MRRSGAPSWTRTAVQHVEEAIVLIDCSGNIVDCNPSAELLYGINA
jgi:PAS domain S-box-containing protein